MLFLKKLNPKKNVNNKYLKWMRNKKTHQFTEQRFEKFTLSKIKKFVIEKNKSPNEFLYGIFLNENKEHIGNIKLGPINFIHKRAYISYFIGNKKHTGNGYAKLAIKEIIKIAKKLKIKKLKAGCYSMNKSSIQVLKKNGFLIEGILRSEIIYKNKRRNGLLFGKIL